MQYESSCFFCYFKTFTIDSTLLFAFRWLMQIKSSSSSQGWWFLIFDLWFFSKLVFHTEFKSMADSYSNESNELFRGIHFSGSPILKNAQVFAWRQSCRLLWLSHLWRHFSQKYEWVQSVRRHFPRFRPHQSALLFGFFFLCDLHDYLEISMYCGCRQLPCRNLPTRWHIESISPFASNKFRIIIVVVQLNFLFRHSHLC